MEINEEERKHIISIMEERGYGHCQECQKIIKKLREDSA